MAAPEDVARALRLLARLPVTVDILVARGGVRARRLVEEMLQIAFCRAPRLPAQATKAGSTLARFARLADLAEDARGAARQLLAAWKAKVAAARAAPAPAPAPEAVGAATGSKRSRMMLQYSSR